MEIVKKCSIHGDLTMDEVRIEKTTRNKHGHRYKCKKCKLTSDLKYREKNREKLCEQNKEYKKNNREIVNQWNRQDRKNNPNKYRKYEENYIKKHGIEKVRKYEVARIHGLTVEQYDELINKYDNKCAICNLPERRLGRDGKTITPLAVDHCHDCDAKGEHIIRGLLCRSCNTALGLLNDKIDSVKKVIEYLEKHKCI